MRSLKIAGGGLVLVLVLSVIFIYSGAYNVAATSSHTALTSWALHKTMERSVERRASGIEVPDLSAEETRLAGLNGFNEMCAVCHTPPGAAASPLARGLNPPAPDLAHAVEELALEELFWITKNGVRMTGMPAWAPTHQDEELWGVIAFLQVLPGLSGEDYREMLKAAEGHGHHAAGAIGDGHDESSEHHDEASDAATEVESAAEHAHTDEEEH